MSSERDEEFTSFLVERGASGGAGVWVLQADVPTTSSLDAAERAC